jgi:hypothetical protein
MNALLVIDIVYGVSASTASNVSPVIIDSLNFTCKDAFEPDDLIEMILVFPVWHDDKRIDAAMKRNSVLLFMILTPFLCAG